MEGDGTGFSPAIVTWMVEHSCKFGELEFVQLLHESFCSIPEHEQDRIPHHREATVHMAVTLLTNQLRELLDDVAEVLNGTSGSDADRWDSLMDAVIVLEEFIHALGLKDDKEVFDTARVLYCLFALQLNRENVQDAHEAVARAFTDSVPQPQPFYRKLCKLINQNHPADVVDRFVTSQTKLIKYNELITHTRALGDAIRQNLGDTVLESMEKSGIQVGVPSSPAAALRVLDSAALRPQQLKDLCKESELDFPSVYTGNTKGIRSFLAEGSQRQPQSPTVTVQSVYAAGSTPVAASKLRTATNRLRHAGNDPLLSAERQAQAVTGRAARDKRAVYGDVSAPHTAPQPPRAQLGRHTDASPQVAKELLWGQGERSAELRQRRARSIGGSKPHEVVVASPSARRLLKRREMESKIIRTQPSVRRHRLEEGSESNWSSDEDEGSNLFADPKLASPAVSSVPPISKRGEEDIDSSDFGEGEDEGVTSEPSRPARRHQRSRLPVGRGRRDQEEVDDDDEVEEEHSAAAVRTAARSVGKKRPASKPPIRSGKRVRRRWTDAEVSNLLEGIKMYGAGKWKTIHSKYDFGDRTQVDLKDKYRNLLRHWTEEEILEGRRK